MVILFWPFIIIAVILSFIALAARKPLFLIISFVLIIPLSLYLAATPLFKWWGPLLPFFYLASALALRKNQLWLTALLNVPVVVIAVWLGYAVITQ